MLVSTILGLASLFFGVASQDVPDVINVNTEAYINKVLADWNSPGGFAVGVVRKDAGGGWRLETKGYGVGFLDGRKMTETTRFSIASNSKLFTIFATGLLINNDTLSPRLSWNSRFASIVPSWSLTDSDASKKLTITDAMSHRSGLPRHDLISKITDTAEDIVRKMKSLRFSAEFRDVFQYNNLMYSLLSTLPQRVLPSKTPFVEYVTRNIIQRLGMNATTYSYVVANATGELADGLTRQDVFLTDDPSKNGTLRAIPYFAYNSPNSTVLAGDGGIISNVVDLTTWLKTLLLNGAHPDTNEVVIPPSVVAKAASGISVEESGSRFPELSSVVYGGGQRRTTYRGHQMIEHGGNVPGHNSQITRFPNLGLGVVVYSNDNTFGALTVEVVKYRLIDEALGVEPIDWSTRYKTLLAQYAATVTKPIPRPANASNPSTRLENLAGRYHNAGYGDFELCLVSPAPSSASSKCKSLLANLPHILPGSIAPNVPTFITEWNRPWGSHVRFSHYNHNVFNISLLSSYPTGNSSEPFWTSDESAGIIANAEFDARGVGLTGIWGAGEDAPELAGNTVRERSEVWFEK